MLRAVMISNENCAIQRVETDIRHWVRDLVQPYLGICLGHQLLVDARGGKVSLMAVLAVGLAEVGLTDEG